MTATAVPTTFPCPRCGNILVYGQLVCLNCGALVYAQRLNELAAEAQREEPTNPIRAAMIWREALPMLPPDSQQHQMVTQRIGALASGMQAAGQESAAAPQEAVVRPSDPWRIAVAKTAGSMLVSIIVYTWMFSRPHGVAFGARFATGFVILILIHELGHVIAMRYFGLSASPPIFIPFLGAVINLRQSPRNALEEAIVGIGGPVLGTLGAGAVYLIYLQTGSYLMFRLAEFGFLLNLFNMLPVPPLDGGRVTAAVSPWIWITGLLALVGFIVLEYFTIGRVDFILILILLFAWPRVKATLIRRQQGGSYYQIGWGARVAMGIAYVLLSVTLATMYIVCRMEIN